MTLGIDISQIVYKGTGVARFTNGLANAILDYDTENKWVFFFSSLRQKLDKSLINKIKSRNHRLVSLPIPPTLLAFLWNDLHILPVELFTGKLDLFITSDWSEAPADCKKATIVHDLIFKLYPETVNNKILSTQTKRFKWIQKESQILFADSLATQQDLENVLQIDENKIKTIYPGVDIATVNQGKVDAVLARLQIKKPFILTVGKIEPRKNLPRLIEAFYQLPATSYQLVIVGPEGWGNINIPKNPNIIFTGFLSDEDLFSLYSDCLFFIFPSIYEGFGYPAVEAMKLGIPTALADTSSLKEIGDHASLMFDPHDVNSIYDALSQMSTNENLRNELGKKGKQKSEQYTWKNYYNQFIERVKT